MRVIVQNFFDQATSTLSYLVSDPQTGEAAVIDPLMDFDPAAVRVGYQSAQSLLSEIESQNLTLKWIIETHAHADHLSAAHWLKQKTGAKIVIGEGIIEVQNTFNQLYQLEGESAGSEGDFDRLVKDGDNLPLGNLTIDVIGTPGHTPSCCAFLVGDVAFVGDTIFMPDFGTARCDFPGGNAEQLYQSIQKLLALPDETRLFTCHDYMPGGRELRWEASVEEQKNHNIHIHQGVDQQAFIKMRTERDAQLPVPKLILPALQVNIKGGRLPSAGETGIQFLKLPINQF
ncbi:MBL fold metallo-hydrolase [Aliikangiella coralliicola]|uniref:MBL fold metallo-hydrolase n=1 Tax=Aliikangiella coralliicola TaxID=2592383 RepID=A0A545UGX2_9GAMM|nr:MBL fold metallo-hydrolase [Aliikangiella coralliicola]TQV88716.1 MBL fold metallo-hydrolase [Aliikangiella coralliicola]